MEERDWMKEGEGISQSIYMYNPWTQTTVWWWTEERGGWEQGSKGEGNRDIKKKREQLKYILWKCKTVEPISYWVEEEYALGEAACDIKTWA